jgi:hypothetical protein
MPGDKKPLRISIDPLSFAQVLPAASPQRDTADPPPSHEGAMNRTDRLTHARACRRPAGIRAFVLMAGVTLTLAGPLRR